MERYSNKRMLFRQGGRFAKAPSLEALGFDVNDGPRKCSCGHIWSPLLTSGTCPACGARDSQPIPPERKPDGPIRLKSPGFIDPRWRFPRSGIVMEDGIEVRVEGIPYPFRLDTPLPPTTTVSVSMDRWFWANPQPTPETIP